MHLSLTPFPISTRNSVASVAYMIHQTGVVQLYVSPDESTQRLAREAAKKLAEDGYHIEILPMLLFTDLFDENNANIWESNPVPMSECDTTLVFHTSGALKLLYLTAATYALQARTLIRRPSG